MKNLDKADQSMRILLGGTIVGLGLINRKWWTILGLFPLITGSLKYCPMKNIFQKAGQDKMTISEMTTQPIDGEDGLGGYRTGNPASGKVQTENYSTIHDA